MGKILCKIFRFLADVFSKLVDFVVTTIKTIGNAVVDILSDLFQAAGNAIGDIFKSNPLFWLGGGLLLWFFMTGKDDDDQSGPTPQPVPAIEV